MNSAGVPQILSLALARFDISDLVRGAVQSPELASWDGSQWMGVAGPLDEFFSPPQVGGGRYADPASLVALATARAVKASLPPLSPERLGCILGTRTGNAGTIAQCEAARLAGRRMSPMLFAHAGWNVPVALAAAELGGRGFTATICAGVRSGEEALGAALRALGRGRADAILVGAVAFESLTPDGGGGAALFQAACLACLLVNGEDRVGKSLPLNLNLLSELPRHAGLPEEITAFAGVLAHWHAELVETAETLGREQ